MAYNQIGNLHKAIFFDRDGVINEETGVYNWRIEDFRINDGIIKNLKELHKLGYLFFVISNQGGIAKGLYTKKDVENLHQYMLNEFIKNNIEITQVYYCPHHPDFEKCICRKPDSLLIEKAISKYSIDPEKSYFFGDKKRDIEAARKVNIKGILIEANENIEKYLKSRILNT